MLSDNISLHCNYIANPSTTAKTVWFRYILVMMNMMVCMKVMFTNNVIFIIILITNNGRHQSPLYINFGMNRNGKRLDHEGLNVEKASQDGAKILIKKGKETKT